jgi:hypothetical protein
MMTRRKHSWLVRVDASCKQQNGSRTRAATRHRGVNDIANFPDWMRLRDERDAAIARAQRAEAALVSSHIEPCTVHDGFVPGCMACVVFRTQAEGDK